MNGHKRFWAVLLTVVLLLPAAAGFAFPKVFYRGDDKKPQIAITMDDCWKIKYVEQMLDLCKEYGFHMTFFPCGMSIREDTAELWKRVVAEGHELGNHTKNHSKLTKLDRYLIGTELRAMKKRLDSALGYEYDMIMMRPPYGSFGGGNMSAAARAIENNGYPYIIMWSVSQTDPDKMLKQIKNGDILLYHSNKKDVEGLRKAIPVLLDRGFELVTVSELLGIGPEDAQTL